MLVATFLGALEVVLDRGLEDDWFASTFIVTFSVVCAVAFVLMIPWEMSRRNPMIDLRMVATRQFGACFLVMLATGAILLATTQFLPQLVQQDFGYTATWAGLLLSPGGIVTMLMMFVVGRLAAKVQPKYLIVAGAVIIAISMYEMTNVYGDLGFWYMARSRMLLGVGLPLIFVPIMAASYDGIPQSKTDQASASDQRGAQHRRLDRRLDRVQRADASRAVPSEPAGRKRAPVERPISGHATPRDGLFRGPGQLAAPGAAAGHPMDRTAGAGTGLVPGLHGCLLGADADLARRRAARAHPAQGQARRACFRSLI